MILLQLDATRPKDSTWICEPFWTMLDDPMPSVVASVVVLARGRLASRFLHDYGPARRIGLRYVDFDS